MKLCIFFPAKKEIPARYMNDTLSSLYPINQIYFKEVGCGQQKNH